MLIYNRVGVTQIWHRLALTGTKTQRTHKTNNLPALLSGNTWHWQAVTRIFQWYKSWYRRTHYQHDAPIPCHVFRAVHGIGDYACALPVFEPADHARSLNARDQVVALNWK